MESSTPKDVEIPRTCECKVYQHAKTSTSDNCIFIGDEITIDSSFVGVGGRVTTELIVLGNESSVETDFSELVFFEVKVKRTDVIEILKYGQFIKIKGTGDITEIRAAQRDDKKRRKGFVISVNGVLDIR